MYVGLTLIAFTIYALSEERICILQYMRLVNEVCIYP